MKIRITLSVVLLLALVACSVDEVIGNIDIALQGVQNIGDVITAINPEDGAAVQAGAAVVAGDLNLLKSLYDGWKSSGATGDLAKLQAAVTEAQANVTQIEAATHLKSAAAQDAFLATMSIASLAISTVADIVGDQNQSPPIKRSAMKFQTSNVAAFASRPVKWHPSDLKRKWDTEVCKGDKNCRSRVHKR